MDGVERGANVDNGGELREPGRLLVRGGGEADAAPPRPAAAPLALGLADYDQEGLTRPLQVARIRLKA